MTTERQYRQRRAARDRIAAAADRARTTASRGQAEHAAGRAPVMPADRFVFIGLLDELALAAGLGQLPAGVLRLALEASDAVMREPQP
ncbi:hypothetical protein HUO13_28580 [Saccharopolyspora erythraea]|uniref:hypothetical protein n=1 Tax=Saccharopolyspora erythraea TaxID=1836 RepID=UPI001BA76DA4|nr:hypothetical protein [Saccharopolyspora erythraea]QUH04221.1 hypothetical protein HUO13_28580 [Saccharopolyspora erythraea]